MRDVLSAFCLREYNQSIDSAKCFIPPAPIVDMEEHTH